MKRFKKKVTRTTGILFLSLGLFISPLFASAPKAASSTTVTSYGQYYYESGYENANFMYQLTESWLFKNISACSYITFSYDFYNTYDGYVNLTVTSAQSFAWQNVHFYCEGAVFTQQPNMTNSSTTKSFQVRFQSSKGFKLVIFDTSGSVFNSSSKITVGTFNFNVCPDIAEELDALHTSWDYYVPGMSTSLANIANNTSTMASDIAILKGYVDQLEGYVDNLEPYLNQLINIQKIQAFPIWQQNALFWANKMGTLQFDKQSPYFYYDSSLNIQGPSNPKRIKIDPNKTVSLIFYCDVNVTNSNYHIYGSQVANVSAARSISSIVPTYPLYLIRLDFTSSHTTSVFISVEFDNSFNLYPLFLGDSKLIPDDIHILFGDDYDNTYTRLLLSIDSGIQAIASNPTVINNTETIINNYETAYNEINNIENNVLIDFSSDLNDVNVNITNSGILGDLPSGMTGAVNWFDYSFGLVQGIDLFKYPVYTILVLFVLGCLLG